MNVETNEIILNNLFDRCEAYRGSTNDLFSRWKKVKGTVALTVDKKEKIFEINHADNVFITDGVICPEQWFSQKVRPLFLLKEAYGRESDWDLIADHLNNEKKQASKMWQRVALWTYGLMMTTKERIEPYTTVLDCGQYGNEWLKKIAVVNVKKSDGMRNSDMDTIRAYATFDHGRLRDQLEICDPTIIVCGYTGFALDKIMEASIRNEKNANLFYHTSIKGHDVIVLDYWHPSNYYPDLMNYYGLMGIYNAALPHAHTHDGGTNHV